MSNITMAHVHERATTFYRYSHAKLHSAYIDLRIRFRKCARACNMGRMGDVSIYIKHSQVCGVCAICDSRMRPCAQNITTGPYIRNIWNIFISARMRNVVIIYGHVCGMGFNVVIYKHAYLYPHIYIYVHMECHDIHMHVGHNYITHGMQPCIHTHITQPYGYTHGMQLYVHIHRMQFKAFIYIEANYMFVHMEYSYILY